MKKKLLNLLLKILYLINKDELVKEYERRVEIVGKVIYEFLATRIPNLLVVEQGRFNFFPLEDGNLPKIDFYIPEFNLFIVVGDHKTATWEEARTLGVSRLAWETTQSDLTALTEYLYSQNTEEYKVRILIIDWTMPCKVEGVISNLNKIGIII